MWIVGVILVIALGTWGYIKYSNRNTALPTENNQTDDTSSMRITAKHQFKPGVSVNSGEHIIAGEIDLPTACYVLGTNAIVAESMPEQVTIAFTATTQGDVCAQVITTERFKVNFTASKDAVIKATWNGKPAILNLIPAGANEDLDNFEIFIKG